MEKPKPNAPIDPARFDALMEHYRAQILRYQRATAPGKQTLAQNAQAAQTAPAAEVPAPSPMPMPQPAPAEEMPEESEAAMEAPMEEMPMEKAPRGAVLLSELLEECEPEPEEEMTAVEMMTDEASQEPVPVLDMPPVQIPPLQETTPEPEPVVLWKPMPLPTLMSESTPGPEPEFEPVPGPVPEPMMQAPAFDREQALFNEVAQPPPGMTAAPFSDWEAQPPEIVHEPRRAPPPFACEQMESMQARPAPCDEPSGYRQPFATGELSDMQPYAAMLSGRPPERLMCAKGVGAYGRFRPYERMNALTMASFLQNPSNEVGVKVRFSADVCAGGADTQRCLHGLCVKFYAPDGEFDLIGAHLPVFMLRDFSLMPRYLDANACDARGLRSFDAFWRLMLDAPEAINYVLWLFSDNGTISSYRSMDAWCPPMVCVNARGERKLVRFSWIAQQRPSPMNLSRAKRLEQMDPDVASRELWDSLKNGEPVRYELCAQVLESEEAAGLDFDPVDATVDWPQERIPVIRIGLLTLEQPCENHMEETEQAAYSPAQLIRGFELLDVGPLPAFSLFCAAAQQRRTGMTFNRPAMSTSAKPWGCAAPVKNAWTQAKERLARMSLQERERLAGNLSAQLKLADSDTAHQVTAFFSRADQQFGLMLANALQR